MTVAGAGAPELRRGCAIHLYCANRDMDRRALYDADGDLLLMPEQGALTLLTELGPLEVAPGQIARDPPRGWCSRCCSTGRWRAATWPRRFGRHFQLARARPGGRQRAGRRPALPGARRLVRGQAGRPTSGWSPSWAASCTRPARTTRPSTWSPGTATTCRTGTTWRTSPRVGSVRFDHPDPSHPHGAVGAAGRAGRPHAGPDRVPAPLGRQRRDLPPALLPPQPGHRGERHRPASAGPARRRQPVPARLLLPDPGADRPRPRRPRGGAHARPDRRRGRPPRPARRQPVVPVRDHPAPVADPLGGAAPDRRLARHLGQPPGLLHPTPSSRDNRDGRRPPSGGADPAGRTQHGGQPVPRPGAPAPRSPGGRRRR